jgi:hypothetical protein
VAEALAVAQGQTPTDSYLRPGFSSAPRTRAFRLSPDLVRGRALAHGFRGTVVLYACTRPYCATVSRIVTANLAPLGIAVKVRPFDDQFAAAAKLGTLCIKS